MSLNKRLKFVRKQSGKTQATLAKELNVSEGTIKRYEKDSSKIPVAIVSKIALLCDADKIWLFTGQTIDSDSNKNKQKIQPDSDNLNPKQIIIEHQDIVKCFKDQEKGLLSNERLIDIEAASPNNYEKITNQIKEMHEIIEIMKEEKKTQKKSPVANRTQKNPPDASYIKKVSNGE